jgi:hypothetical protein
LWDDSKRNADPSILSRRRLTLKSSGYSRRLGGETWTTDPIRETGFQRGNGLGHKIKAIKARQHVIRSARKGRGIERRRGTT